jgi:hypothetical protein
VLRPEDDFDVAVTTRTLSGGSGSLTEHRRHSLVIHLGGSLTPNDQAPAFKVIPTRSAKAINGMFPVTFGRLFHDHTEIVSALGASSSDVLLHKRRY